VLIGHTGDFHLADGPRFADTVQCLEWIATDGAGAGVGLWLVGGDLAGTTVPHVASVNERAALASIFLRMAMTAPVVIVRGNHDVPQDIDVYGLLGGRHRIDVVGQPGMVVLENCLICCLPYPSKRHAVAGGAVKGSFDAQRQAIEAELRTILGGFRVGAADARRAGRPSVGLMHICVGGSIVGGGEVLIGREIELSPHDLTELGLDAGCLSHIHKAQMMAPGWWYAGSPSAQNFGEQGDRKSYNLITVAPGAAPTCELRFTPARRLVTVDMAWAEQDGKWRWLADTVPLPESMTDAEVRLRVRVPEAAAATCPVERAVARLHELGAHSVQVDKRILPSERVRSEAIGLARTTAEKVGAYWDSLESGQPDPAQRTRALTCLEKLEQGEPDAPA